MSAFKVETDKEPCSACGAGAEYSVVGPDGVAEGTTYLDEDDAESMAAALNTAYEAGLAAAAVTSE